MDSVAACGGDKLAEPEMALASGAGQIAGALLAVARDAS